MPGDAKAENFSGVRFQFVDSAGQRFTCVTPDPAASQDNGKLDTTVKRQNRITVPSKEAEGGAPRHGRLI